MRQKTGIVDVGGGMRGIYAAGVFDFCMDAGIHFDAGVGVSAGSANLASFAAGQARRNRRFFERYSQRKEYMSWGNWLHRGSYLDLDYIYGTLSAAGGEDPLDCAAMQESPMELLMVATEAWSGKPRYFPKEAMHPDDYRVLKASSAIPFVCRPQWIEGRPYFDGALGDTVPIEKAFELGCGKVVLLLTLPVDTVRTAKKDRLLAAGIRKEYPLAAKRLERRAEQYNAGVAAAKRYAERGELLIIAPDDTCGVTTLKHDPACMVRLYEKGYHDGEKIVPFLAADPIAL